MSTPTSQILTFLQKAILGDDNYSAGAPGFKTALDLLRQRYRDEGDTQQLHDDALETLGLASQGNQTAMSIFRSLS